MEPEKKHIVEPNPLVEWGFKHSSIVILIVAVLVAVGVLGLDRLKKNEFPDFVVRQGLIVAVYPGATAEQMEREVVGKLEDFVFTYGEVCKEKTHTDITPGLAVCYVELNADISESEPLWNKIKHDVSNLKTSLPAGVLAVRVMSDFGKASSLLITLSSREKTYRELSGYVDALKDRLRTVESVGALKVSGEQQEQISVYYDSERLASYGIRERAIAMQLLQQSFLPTAGSLRDSDYTLPIGVATSLSSLKDVADQIVYSGPEGSLLRLSDLARVVREFPEPTSYVTNNGARAIVLSVEVKSGRNVVKMGQEVDLVLDAFKAELPEGVNLFAITNQPHDVSNSVVTFLRELMIAIVAVLIVIVLLLPLRVAMLASVTIPITIFVSLALFLLCGIELNTVTLACLILSLGIIADDSIVIIDNYVELLQEGFDRRTAAISSASEFLKSVFSATMAITFTFFPFLFTVTGMFRDFLLLFPWSLCVILYTSFLIVELLLPIMLYNLIKTAPPLTPKSDCHKRFSILGTMQGLYDWLILRCMAYPKSTLAVVALLLVTAVGGVVTTPMCFMPTAERNQFAVEIYMPTGTPLKRTSAVANALSAILRQDKRVESVAIFHGAGSPRFQTTYAPKVGGSNFAQLIVNTTGNKATVALLDHYAPLLQDMSPQAFIRFKQLSFSATENPVEVRLQGPDYHVLQELADSVVAVMRGQETLCLIRNSLDAPLLEAHVEPDPTLLARMGLTTAMLESTFALRYGSGIPLATLWEGNKGVSVVLKSNCATQADAKHLNSEQIAVMPALSSPLNQFAQVNPKLTYGALQHRNGLPTVTLSADVARGAYPYSETERLFDSLEGFNLPEGYTLQPGGDVAETQELIPQFAGGLMIAAFIIFGIILFHYGRVRLSLLLFLSLILVLPGTAVGLKVMGIPITLTVILGIVTLMGILVRNALIMIDYAQKLQLTEGLGIKDSIETSARRRMRPIFLTSMAASVGVVPMVLSDSGLWHPMGCIIFLGAIVMMFFVLTVIPIVYAMVTPEKDTDLSD